LAGQAAAVTVKYDSIVVAVSIVTATCLVKVKLLSNCKCVLLS